MCGSGTGSDNCKIRPLETEHNGQITRNHIDNGTRDEEWRDFARTPCMIGVVSILDHRQTTDTGTDIDTDTLGIKVRTGYIPDTRILNRLDRCSHAIMDKDIHATRVLGRKIVRDIEILDLPGYLRRKCGRIETCNSGRARFSCDYIGPRIRNGVTDRRNNPHTGYDYPTLGQSDSEWGCLKQGTSGS